MGIGLFSTYLLRLYRVVGGLDDHVFLAVNLQPLRDNFLRTARVIERLGDGFALRLGDLASLSAQLSLVTCSKLFVYALVEEMRSGPRKRTLKPADVAHGWKSDTPQIIALSMLPVPRRLRNELSERASCAETGSDYLESTYAE
jgi:hypothetical protein